MGQKVHPTGIRLGIVKEHTSVWYADGRTYADYLLADLNVREYLQDKLKTRVRKPYRYPSPGSNRTHHHPHRSSRHCDRQEG